MSGPDADSGGWQVWTTPHSPGCKGEISAASGADAVVLADLGCMLNIEWRLRRREDQGAQVLHVAEVLAGETEGP